MPQVVNHEKNRKLICYRETFAQMLNSQYNKIIETFAQNPAEILNFITMFKSEGDSWASDLSPELNTKWKEKKADYFIFVLDKYLSLMVREKNAICIEFVNRLKIAQLELDIHVLQGIMNDLDLC